MPGSARPLRVWPVVLTASLLAGAGAIRLVGGLVPHAGAVTPAGPSAPLLLGFVVVKSAVLLAISAAAFGLAHGDALHASLMVIVGVLLGWLTEEYQSLRPALVAHVANNVVSCVWERSFAERLASPSGWVAQLVVGLVVTAASLVALRSRALATLVPPPSSTVEGWPRAADSRLPTERS